MLYSAGELGYAYVKGLQSEGVSAQVKHFVRSPIVQFILSKTSMVN